MESPAERKIPKKWLVAVFGLVALVLAGLAFGPAALEWIDRSATTDARIRADIEETLADFKTYQALKELYPEAYEELIRLIINNVSEGTDINQAVIGGAEFTTKLRRDNAQYYAMASAERLRLSLNAQIPQYSYLKTAYGFKACNELAANGGLALARMLGADFIKDHTLTQMMDETTGYFFRTAAEGRQLKLHHDQPTSTDWQIATDYLKTKGMTDADLTLINASQKNLDDARLCDVTIKFFENITTMNNDAATRIVPYLAANAAAG